MRAVMTVLVALALIGGGIGIVVWVKPAPEPDPQPITLVAKPKQKPAAPVDLAQDRTHVPKSLAEPERCLKCHAEADEPGLKIEPVDALCAECHQSEKPHPDKNHASGVALPIGMSTWLPLSVDGTMTCATCHDPHGTRPGLVRGGGRPSDMCLSCHVGY